MAKNLSCEKLLIVVDEAVMFAFDNPGASLSRFCAIRRAVCKSEPLWKKL